MQRFRLLLTSLLLLSVLLPACGGTSSDTPGDAASEALHVTCTTGMIADVARNIGGNAVEVTALMGPGVDPHLYKATQGDLRRLTEADLVLYNGLHLEGRMGDVLEQMDARVPTVAVGEAVPEDKRRMADDYAGQYDPHVWFDVSLWVLVAERIRDALVEQDPANADSYRERAEAYLAEMRAMDDYAREQIATIPEEARLLVTAHDAFGYFGDAYDMDVMGIQGISTAGEYGLQDLNRVVDIIVDRKVKAVFVETSISPKSIEALVEGVRAKGHEVAIGGDLYSDAMGAEGTPEGTYLGMVKHNVDTIVEALR